MMIDGTFFQDGMLCIEGVAVNDITPDATNAAIKSALEACIGQYEPEYLEGLLGEKLCDEFTGYLSSDREEERWERLKEKLIRTAPFPRSPIANYVYFHFLRNNDSAATITGVKKDEDDGALVSPERKMIFAWNDMVRQNEKIARFMLDNMPDYEGWELDEDLLTPINSFGI